MKESEFNQIIMALGQKCDDVEAKLNNYLTLGQGKSLKKEIINHTNVINKCIDMINDLSKKVTDIETKINSLKTVESTSEDEEMNKLKKRVDLLSKNINPEVVSYKTFTPKEIAELKKTMTWPKLSAYLKCSISTCQRLVKQGKEGV